MLYSLSSINKVSSYRFYESDDDTICFVTDSGAKYSISFIEDNILGLQNVYQFCIEQDTKGASAGVDNKIAQSVVALLQSFFATHENILLFVCDNTDKHESARYRKFSSWFNKYADHELMEMHSASIDDDDSTLYASIIYSKQMKDADLVAETFQTAFEELRSK